MCPFVLGCRAFGRVHESFVLTAFDPLKDLRNAPDRERMRQSGRDHVGPETIEGLLVVVLLKVTRLGEKLILLDVRTERSLETSESMAQAAVRMPPEHVVAQARELDLPKDAWLVAYCA